MGVHFIEQVHAACRLSRNHQNELNIDRIWWNTGLVARWQIEIGVLNMILDDGARRLHPLLSNGAHKNDWNW